MGTREDGELDAGHGDLTDEEDAEAPVCSGMCETCEYWINQLMCVTVRDEDDGDRDV